jgi:Uncharacterised protein family (UPF0158)
MTQKESSHAGAGTGSATGPTGPIRDVPVDWEALEDAFENNAPEVHSYLHLTTGEVLRVVDGVADPQMHVRIASDGNYLRIDPVSSREQYRWMERFIPMVEDLDLRGKLTQAIDGKGAFRRFKDVLMSFAAERERWFQFRSERLRTFMEAWLNAHAIKATPRPAWGDGPPSAEEAAPDSLAPFSDRGSSPSVSSAALVAAAAAAGAGASGTDAEGPKSASGRRTRNAEASRQHLRELSEGLGPRELETLVSFAEFLKARRAARGFAHHHEHQMQERMEAAAASVRGTKLAAEGEGGGQGT